MILDRSTALAVFFIAFITNTGYSQDFSWTSLTANEAKSSTSEISISAKKASYFNFEYDQPRNEFANSFSMEIPMSDGSFRTFLLEENSTMSEGLQLKFPEIKSYNARATDGSGYLGKVDFSAKGFHAMLLHPVEKTQFIDPLYLSENPTHIVYRKNDFITDKEMICEAEFDLKGEGLGDPKSGINYNTCVLRTYRIAIAATGEYTIFHGGSVAQALAAQVTTMNRVNGIYERDFGVTMTLVPNNDEIIYTNPSTDPYSNGQTFAMINENPPVINDVIGFSNYDIGHVFGTNSGGLAGFGVTCENGKARGVTGNNAPIGDPFDVDYVAHEIGHQFGASHTFNNSCNGNRSDATAVEPGSGSTIMAYAGICNPNVQSNSDDHFHGVSMRQIGFRVNADNCPIVTDLSNLSPVLDSVPSEFFVPAQTAFALTAFASDPDPDDVLTYNFEQIDNEISQQPPLATATEGPNFRSFSPTTNPTQYFPRLETLTGSGLTTWQVLSAVERSMTFRCTVKDNAEGGGCAQYEDLQFGVVESAGPFVLTQPNSSNVIWEAFTEAEVSWDVANSDLPPINAEFVDLFLSTDGGITYPYTLAEGVPNDGLETIIVPNTPSEDARVMVMNAEGTFFDISNSDFTVIGLTIGFLLQVNDTVQSACVGENLTFEISVLGVGGFDELVTLSLGGDLEGIDAVLTDNTLMPGETTTLTISGTEDIDAGILDILLIGDAPSFNQNLLIQAGFNSIVPETPTLLIPQDGAEFVPTNLTLDWVSSDSPDALYTIEVSEDPFFETDVTTLVSEVSSQVTVNGLSPATTYYWRVKKETICSEGDFSEVFSFSTHTCFPFASADVPLTISAVSGEYISTLEVADDGIIQDLNVLSLEGVHGSTGQLEVSLISPSGVEVVLFSEVCEGTQDFNLGFDDSSDLEVIDCPATTGSTYKPTEALSSFIGEGTAGTWSLVVADNTNGGGGALNNWSLEFCIANSGSFVLTKDDGNPQVCQGSSTTLSITAEEVFAFEDIIELTAVDVPQGITVDFNPNLIAPGQSSVITIAADTEIESNVYDLLVTGTSLGLTDSIEFEVEVNLSSPEAIELLSPAEDELLSTIGFFEWEAISSPSALYTLEIATDEEFSDVVESVETMTSTSTTLEGLLPSQTLFWRVTANNGCVLSSSSTSSFLTEACAVYQADEGLPLSITPVASLYTLELDLAQAGTVQSISIPEIQGTHFRVSDLVVSLESPGGTEVILFSNICISEQDFNLGFFEGGEVEIDCPPTTGLFYEPETSFSNFAGEDAQGVWKLKVNDTENGGGGQLNSWSLQVCYDDDVSATYGKSTTEFQIYPNPTQGIITVSSEEEVIEEILVYDIYGRMIDHLRGNANSSVDVDLTPYAKGAFLVEVRGSFGTVTNKVIRN